MFQYFPFLVFQKMVASYGIYNSLSQTLLKIAAPGVPDFYQGTEFWDLSLVDPDNRRPVDFSLRTWLLNEMKSREREGLLKLIDELLKTREDGRIKLFLIYKALDVRRRYRILFERGGYVPLETEGKYKDNIIAFARDHRPDWIITVAPRFLTGVVKENQLPLGTEVWDDTHIILPTDAPTKWDNGITGISVTGERTVAVGDILKHFPCSLLIST